MSTPPPVRPTDAPMRVLCWGSGTIGGTAGAYLARAGHDVTLVDADAAHIAAIRAKGLHVSGPVDDFVIEAPAFTPGEVSRMWDIVLLAVKAQHTEAACRMLAPHLSAEGCVVSLQNGLCKELIAGVLGSERTIASFVNYAGDLLGPGEIHFGARGALAIGEYDNSMTPRLKQIETLLRDFEPRTEATPELGAFIWGKLCFTVLLIAQALGEKSIADCLSRDELLPLWRALGGEIVAVAHAEGVTPGSFDGVDPPAFLPGASEAATLKTMRDIVAYNRQGAKTHSGYWRDIAVRKRKTEAEYLLLPVIGLARKHGVPCPAVDALLAMLLEVESGKRAQSDANLPELQAALPG